MDRPTVALYERKAAEYEARRRGHRRVGRARAFARRVRPGGLRVDLGCGPGLVSEALGRPLVGLDAAHAMLERARTGVRDLLAVRADLEALPFRGRALAGAWARMSYLHLAREDLPAALAQLHAALEVGAPFEITLLPGAANGLRPDGDDFPGRFFAGWEPDELVDLLTGAGFDDIDVRHERLLVGRGVRRRTLPDTVGGNLRVLVCGLNPSLHAAEAGFGYAGPGNRFWRAALDAGLVARPDDPIDALKCGVGMTDLVKRATARAAEVSRDEFRDGARRVERLVRWLRPAAVCFVGLTGYRAAINRGAEPGWQPEALGGAPTYVMPSTSGLNTHTSFDEIVRHLRIVDESSR